MAVDVEAMYRRYGPMVLRRCRQILGDPQQASDAMQDVFVQIVRRKEQLDDRASSSLLYRTATNICLNRLRSQRRKPSEPASETIARLAAAGEEVDRGEARAVLRRLFGGEPESTATIAMLHLHDGLTLEETAAEVGMSVSGVRKRLRKLKATLGDLAHATADGMGTTSEARP
ncbi:RNA polymerase sigma factor [Paraliomyxa miuraensis]|nr:RNA polymerase sigma factor [Paraliomyxa miuraensis]